MAERRYTQRGVLRQIPIAVRFGDSQKRTALANRYAELTLRAKAKALCAWEVGCDISTASRARAAWKDGKTLPAWLYSL